MYCPGCQSLIKYMICDLGNATVHQHSHIQQSSNEFKPPGLECSKLACLGDTADSQFFHRVAGLVCLKRVGFEYCNERWKGEHVTSVECNCPPDTEIGIVSSESVEDRKHDMKFPSIRLFATTSSHAHPPPITAGVGNRDVHKVGHLELSSQHTMKHNKHANDKTPNTVLQNESIQEGNSQGVLLQIEHPGTYIYVPIQVQTY
jgi:hypothetical protein